jgi:membrane protein YdbS with pleckstrin-like domain
MKCASCGGEVAPASSFCPHCGERTDTTDGEANNANARSRTAAASRMRPGGSSGSGNQPNEEELWSGTYSPKAMVGPAVGLAVLTIIALVIGFLLPPFGLIVAGGLAIIAWAALGTALLYRRMSVRYRLTTFRFFHETGLLSRKRNRIEVIDINDVTLSQGIIERMFNVGTIHIQSSDVTDPNLYLPGIEDVGRVTDLIDNTRRAERQRRGLFMENIGGVISS